MADKAVDVDGKTARASRLLARGDGLLDQGVRVDFRTGIAPQRGCRGLDPDLGRGERLPGLFKPVVDLVQRRGGRDPPSCQLRLPARLGFGKAQVRPRQISLGERGCVRRLELPDLDPRRRDRRVGLSQCDAIRLRVHAEQQVAGLHVAVLGGLCLDHAARKI